MCTAVCSTVFFASRTRKMKKLQRPRDMVAKRGSLRALFLVSQAFPAVARGKGCRPKPHTTSRLSRRQQQQELND